MGAKRTNTLLWALDGPARIDTSDKYWGWDEEHTRAEEATQDRVILASTSAVFAPLIARIGAENARAQGWCV